MALVEDLSHAGMERITPSPTRMVSVLTANAVNEP